MIKINQTKLFLFLFVLSTSLNAKEDSVYLESFLKDTKSYKNIIHTNYTNTVISIDNYISNDYQNKHKESMPSKNYIFIQSSLLKAESAKAIYTNKIKFKLFLPKFKKKYNLIFESEDNLKASDHKDEKPEDIEYDLAISKDKKFKNNIIFKKKIGIKLKTKLNPFVQLSLAKNLNINSLRYSLSQEFKASIINEIEVASLFSITNKISDLIFLNNINRYYWISKYKKENNIFNIFSLSTKFSSKNSLSYNLSFISNNKDSTFKLKKYAFYLDFKHKIKKWLYVNIRPENFFEKQKGFTSEYQIAVSLSLLIDKK